MRIELKMKMNVLTNKIFVICFSLFIIGFVSAVPGIPHQFYGSVSVNGVSAPDNNIISAAIEGDVYMTVTKDGKYGLSPNIFYIEDPFGDRVGKTVNFFMDGLKVGSAIFSNNGYTKLDFSAKTTCGDNYCIGSETCGICPGDCGICTTPPAITISSPENNKLYDALEINLDVSSDQPIIVWLYSLNSQTPITFIPNIILTAQEGLNNLTVIGISNVFQSGQSSVSFNVDLPDDFCGNSFCGPTESCSICSQDCGACPSNGGSSGGGGGGGGGGTIIKKLNTTNNGTANFGQTQNAIVGLGIENSQGNQDSNEGSETQIETGRNFLSSITGAFVSGDGKIKSPAYFGLIIIVLAVIIGLVYYNRKKSKTSSENTFIQRK
jgi:hypothetical protein